MTWVRRVAALSAAALLVAVASGCTPTPPSLQTAEVTVTTTFPARPDAPPGASEGYPRLGGQAPGALLEVEPFTLIDPRITVTGATAWRIRYLSTSAVGGALVPVGGVVFIPGGRPPDGGWQVIAVNHGNTGINRDCGPSLYNDMLNQWVSISVLLLQGYAVVASDYEGLSGEGSHAFLDGPALGRNVIDGVRAARNMRPDIGVRWAALGGSLGGLATWAADEQAATYGTDLDLVGAAAWVPAVDVSGLPAKARAGELSREQSHLYLLAMMGLSRTTAPQLDLGRFLSGSLYENRDLLTVCIGPDVEKAIEILDNIDPADLVPADAAAEAEMTGLLKQMALPQQRAAAPLLVIYGTEDTLIDRPWIEGAIESACALGTSVQWVMRPGEGHGDIDASQGLSWLRERFDGQTPINRCETTPGQF